MLDYAREASEMARGKTKADLLRDRMLNLALVRLLEMVGEAASRVPPEERVKYAGVPWAAIVGLRNRLVHGYDMIDFDVLWQIISTDLHPLIKALERAVPPSGS